MTEKQKMAKTLYERGLSLREVAIKMGCCPAVVWKFLERAGCPRRPADNGKKWESRKAEILFLYETQRMSQHQIAAYYGVSQKMISRVMRRLQIVRRNRGRAGMDHYAYKDGKSSVLYRKLIVKDQCSLCQATKRLVIHHKNGDHYDDRMENLEILCLQCHMSITKKAWWAAKRTGKTPPKRNGPVGWVRKTTKSPQ